MWVVIAMTIAIVIDIDIDIDIHIDIEGRLEFICPIKCVKTVQTHIKWVFFFIVEYFKEVNNLVLWGLIEREFWRLFFRKYENRMIER